MCGWDVYGVDPFYDLLKYSISILLQLTKALEQQNLMLAQQQLWLTEIPLHVVIFIYISFIFNGIVLSSAPPLFLLASAIRLFATVLWMCTLNALKRALHDASPECVFRAQSCAVFLSRPPCCCYCMLHASNCWNCYVIVCNNFNAINITFK